MRIVIDLQGAQSESRLRGIGRYSLSLAKAIVRNRGKHEIIIALSGLFPNTIESIRAQFNELLPQENIRVWYAPGPVVHMNAENDWRRHAAELVREAFLASLKPDVVLVTSLFEGLSDDAVTSIGLLSHDVPTAAILYDLIPLIYRHPYLENPVIEAWYENKLDHLRRADLLLAISESSRQEGIRYLSFPEEASVNISTAADSKFRPFFVDTKQEIEVRRRYNLQRPYVMYTGGIDYRKNIEGLIRAYATLTEIIRIHHQLVVVCAVKPHDKTRLENLAMKQGLAKNEFILTGFVPDDDLLILYNLCKLFVFPSWHEGFGLPALEAMSCGRAVIGTNTSSIPEVIGRVDALFEAKNDEAIAGKITKVLTDDTFRLELQHHGLEQAKKFLWDKSATRAIAAFERLQRKRVNRKATATLLFRRPKLAYVSPLPPARSGIADYSAELLPELACHYEIDVIVAQESVFDPWIKANCTLRSIEWFKSHFDRYDRVLYQFGNSDFHQHMFSLLQEIPGVVVLHDFFLSGIKAHMDFHKLTSNGWTKELYQAHGYKAVQYRFHATNSSDVIFKYPCNISVLRGAQGIIVHSANSRRLATQWYGPNVADDWALVPLLRSPALDLKRDAARRTLNLENEKFIIGTFGMLAPTKLNHQLLDAWLASDLARNNNCVLIFVGENEGGEYGRDLLATIDRSGLSKRIRITGWINAESFRHYLAAIDIGVQLRANSRGETSAAVLDCMNYGIATIVNANGSMADLPDDAVWKLPDKFSSHQLIKAMETLWQDARLRKQLGAHAQETIRNHHAPRACADKYFEAIENFYRKSSTNIHSLTNALAHIEPAPSNPELLLPLVEAVAKSIPTVYTTRQLLIDISILVMCDSQSGIQRVVKSILHEWLNHPPEGLRVEPVYATTEQGYRYARSFTMGFLNCQAEILSDEPVEYQAGDVFLGLDLPHHGIIAHSDFYQQMHHNGVEVRFMIIDSLFIIIPQCFNFGENTKDIHGKRLNIVTDSDGVICVSKSAAEEVSAWVKKNCPERLRSFKIDWFHLGVDIKNSNPTMGLPDVADDVLCILQKRSAFIMVGTLEPRKGHAQTLAAFEVLWASGVDAILVIVGKQGWQMDKLTDKIRDHVELGKRLFWLEGISDEYLEKVYVASTCLIAASEGEGFGLPLIEAAQHKLPIIARDIPVFREVAGEHAFYFSGLDPKSIAEAVQKWISLFESHQHPTSDDMQWQTWAESAQQLLELMNVYEDTKTIDTSLKKKNGGYIR